MRIVMVLTIHDQLGNTGQRTGFWLVEFAAPSTSAAQALLKLMTQQTARPSVAF